MLRVPVCFAVRCLVSTVSPFFVAVCSFIFMCGSVAPPCYAFMSVLPIRVFFYNNFFQVVTFCVVFFALA